MIRYRIFYALILILLALFYIYCDSYVPILVIIVFISLTVLSVISTAIASKLINVDTSASHPVLTRGEDSDAQFRIKITNKSFFPVSAVIFRVEFDDMQENGGTQRKLSSTLCARDSRTIYTMVSTVHCAYIRCKVCDMYICDAFGLTCQPVKKGVFTSHMTVMPVMADSCVLGSSPSVSADDSDRYSDVKKGYDPCQVFDVREYADGDDVRKIHWRLSSRYDELIVKEFSQPISDSCVVVIETGIKAETPDQRKSVTDRLMSVFMKLSDELIHSEQMFSVYWYSKQGGKNVCFDVVIHDDVFPAVEGYLSMKFSDELCETLMLTEPLFEGNDKRIYYIYSSGSCDLEMLSRLSEKYIPIDADMIIQQA